jgi:hypothetical protein
MTVLNTQYGDIGVEENRSWRGESESAIFQKGRQALDFIAPDQDEPDDLMAGCQIKNRRVGYGSALDAIGTRELIALLSFAADLAELIDEANADVVDEARRQKEERERQEQVERERIRAEREVAQAARREVLAERRELLMNELVGERVRIRRKYRRSMIPCEVVVREKREYKPGEGYVGTGEFEPRFEFRQNDNQPPLDHVLRLDAKGENGKYVTYWDDGVEDLPSYDRDLVDASRERL